ncbi:MAG: 2-oxoglutarate dehydrogenase E1 component [Planctomycetes bacterium]|nr:2-oxoglutarate dehydrogenase E1 component [Planctomycetota bacterium]
MGGYNLGFAEELYAAYAQDPSSVDAEWRAFFAELGEAPQPTSPFPRRSLFGAAGAKNGGGNGHAAVASVASSTLGESSAARQAAVDRLVHAYRSSGHMGAELDPLGRGRPPVPELTLAHHGLDQADLDRPYSGLRGQGIQPLRNILERLQSTYSRMIGAQYMHLDDPAARDWLESRMEASQNRSDLSHASKLRILEKLTAAEQFEQFIHTNFLGAKRFSLEGGESLIPLLDLAIERAARHGVQEVVIGMAHRGRLNVLVNVMGKAPADVFREFQDTDPENYWGRGDVKYHLGHQTRDRTRDGKEVLLTLCCNPSHLEFVNPIVLGRTRARQDERGDQLRAEVMPVILHGDAAFAGQGIVQETLNLSTLQGYATGGALHVIVNNQIGFTTPPESSRSCTYATDVARMLQAPIFHVNGEDPESVAHVAQLAMDFRAAFHQDVFIDLYCYRRYGHNEGDEPAFTQPLMYEQIRQRKTVRAAYLERLVGPGKISSDEAEGLRAKHQERLEGELARSRGESFERQEVTITQRWVRFRGGPRSRRDPVKTALPKVLLSALLERTLDYPEGFAAHRTVTKLRDQRRAMARGEQELDWGAGEALAFASLVCEKHAVRLSGQDAGRGTFSHRHSVLHDQKTGAVHVPLTQMDPQQARFEVWDSPLSECGVLGFEYGFSLDSPQSLVLWEAQFGDFVNTAQVIIDQFISSAEDKWGHLSGLVMLLPHGYEGQGPEHSSARLERFLQLCAEDNIQVVNLTTPAQVFHLLRRQVLDRWRKPLVMMTPKSLLRLPAARSPLSEFSEGSFQSVIEDPREPKAVKRVLLCSGKVYFDLVAYREEHGRDDVAILRMEQLYPIPSGELEEVLGRYADRTPVVWVQEEPWNMGAWFFLRANLNGEIFRRLPLSCVSRDESASPATGSHASHKLEQAYLVQQAFGDA